MISIKSPNSLFERILVVSVYKPPEAKFLVQDWNDLFDQLR